MRGQSIPLLLALLPLTGVLVACVPEDEPQAGAVTVDQASAPAEPAELPESPVAATGATDSRAAEAVKSLTVMNVRGSRLTRVLDGLAQPWAFEFLDEGSVIITERGGRLLHHDLATGSTQSIHGLPAIASDKQQTGLLDVEVHPDYQNNGRIYFSYSAADPDADQYYFTVVATAVLQGQELQELRTLVEAGPPGWSPSNFGGALEFDDQGFLYLSIGDRSEHELSQNGLRLQGKILRLNDDGTVPADNPFVGDETVDDRIWALGVRNAQGLHFDPVSTHLFEVEHGPMGGDEVNIIEAGQNYGWPEASYGSNYTGASLGQGTHAPGTVQPLFYFTPSIAPSPLTVYRGDMFPEWDGDLIIGALKDKRLYRLDVQERGIRSAQGFLGEINARIRDVKVAADGSLFVLTQGGGLYRVWREAMELIAQPDPDGKAIYDLVCAGCHDSGALEAPMLHESDRWETIRAQGRATVREHVLNGIGDMPERGLCNLCADQWLDRAVDYMLEAGAKNPDSPPSRTPDGG